MKRFVLLLPFLFTLASLLQLGYISAIVVSPGQILRPLVVLWGVLALLIWPAYWLTRDWTWAAILLTVFVLGFYFSSDFFSTALLFIVTGTVVWLAIASLTKRKIHVFHFTYILGIIGCFFVGYSIYVTGKMLARIPWRDYRQATNAARNFSLKGLSTPAIEHDIYYIILDDYARSDILQKLYGFDNSDFIDFLHEKGFIVPVSDHSNYPTTPLSVASTLNMDYIQALTSGLENSHNRWLMEPFIDHSRVRALLESQGYKTISLSTNWTITDNQTTDMYYHPYPVMLSDFESFVLDRTPLKYFKPALSSFASVPSVTTHREIVRYNFENFLQPCRRFRLRNLFLPISFLRTHPLCSIEMETR